jgi:hypothetical protein
VGSNTAVIRDGAGPPVGTVCRPHRADWKRWSDMVGEGIAAKEIPHRSHAKRHRNFPLFRPLLLELRQAPNSRDHVVGHAVSQVSSYVAQAIVRRPTDDLAAQKDDKSPTTRFQVIQEDEISNLGNFETLTALHPTSAAPCTSTKNDVSTCTNPASRHERTPAETEMRSSSC